MALRPFSLAPTLLRAAGAPSIPRRRVCLATGLFGWVATIGATPDTTGASAAPASGRRWRVGRPDGELARISDAARLARDGDTVEILAGDYRADVAVWSQRRLRIRALGGPVRLFADGVSAEGKAIWVIRDGEFDIEGIEFRECRVRDGNGAGIRMERGQVRLSRCRFLDNQTGILTGNSPESRLWIDRCEFTRSRHDGGFSHHLYAGRIARLEVRGSSFANAQSGHLLKSRARESLVTYNRLADDPDGRSSYELEFPDGGRALVLGNVLVQSLSTENRTVLSFGAEGRVWSENALAVSHNTFVNRAAHCSFIQVRGAAILSQVVNNLFAGPGGFVGLDAARSDGNVIVHLAERTSIDDPIDGVPTPPLTALARPAALYPGWDPSPKWQYRHPLGLVALAPVTIRRPGAFQ